VNARSREHRRTADAARRLAGHELRILLIVAAAAETHPGGMTDALTRLAKFDFLVRHPAFAAEALDGLSPDDPRLHLSEDDAPRREDRFLLPYHYGPWDERYLPVVGALIGRDLLTARPVSLSQISRDLVLLPTPSGRTLAEESARSTVWRAVADRCTAVIDAAGSLSAEQLTALIATHLPWSGTHPLGEANR
jgi:hypothetical protein